MDVTLILFNIIAFMASGIFHEQCHARAALWLGDPTGRDQKRLSWDPGPHIDPIMTIVIPIASLFLSGGRSLFGMMKPVPIHPHNFGNPTHGMALSAAAGPISNAVLASGAMLVLWLLHRAAPDYVYSEFHQQLTFNGLFLCAFIKMNFLLGGFNLLPLPGLDGSHVLYHFLPPGGKAFMDTIRPHALLVTILLVFNIPGLLDAVFRFFYELLIVLFGQPFARAAYQRLG